MTRPVRPIPAGDASATEVSPRKSGRSHRLLRFLCILGPGLITGASDDDPSGIGTYLIAGAQLGFATLWTALVTFPMMAAVQFLCAKIALVTGEGIGVVLRERY